MTKTAFIEKFKNNDLISDAELLFDLLDTAQEVVKSKFGVSGAQNTGAVIRTAELILSLETAFDEEPEEEN